MTRIPSHSIEDAPQAARSLLAEMGAPGFGPADAGPPAATSGAGG